MAETQVSISLQCPNCGEDDFQFEENKEKITCNSCQHETTKDQLIEDNQELISNTQEEMGKNTIKDIQKEFSKSLKKQFRNSKYIKIK